MRRRRALSLVAALGLAAGVAAVLAWIMLKTVAVVVTSPAPPRAAPTPLPPPALSSIAMPVRLPMALLRQALEDAVPLTLWKIDDPDRVCVPAQRVKLFDTQLKVTPDIRCRIVGTVTRGPIRLAGRGDRLRAELPQSAVVTARDIGGIIKAETATAAAIVTADLRPGLRPDGRLHVGIRLRYDWQQEPGVTVMGQRIRLTQQAEARLSPVLANAEIDLARRLAVPVQARLSQIWRSGFTVQPINRRNPAAWRRLTPQSLGAGDIRSDSKDLEIDMVLAALAEVHVGTAPTRPRPTPLPPIAPAGGRAGAGAAPGAGLTLNVAVLSDYATLEKVIAKALAKLAARGIEVPSYGRVRVRFRRAILYATTGGRLALGLDLTAKGPNQILDTSGRVWLTALAHTAPGSERVLIRDMQLFTGSANDRQLPLLVAVAQAQSVRTTLESALAQDFSRDYDRLMTRVDAALVAVPIGDVRLSARLGDVRHGEVVALGQGLYMPVTARGSARLDYAR